MPLSRDELINIVSKHLIDNTSESADVAACVEKMLNGEATPPCLTSNERLQEYIDEHNLPDNYAELDYEDRLELYPFDKTITTEKD